MGAQPSQVQSSLQALRGTPVEVWSKSEGRWIVAVIGAPKDAREPAPEPSAVLVLFQEVVGGRSDAYKWVKADDIPNLIRARPEAKKQAGMFETAAESNFGTMFEHRSEYEKRGAPEPHKQLMHTQQPNHTQPMHPIPERTLSQDSHPMASGVMGSLMASLTGGVSVPASAAPSAMGSERGYGSRAPSAMGSRAPSVMGSMAPSMASTVDQNASFLQSRQAPMGSMAPSMMATMDQNSSRLDVRHGQPMCSMASVPEEKPSFMASLLGTNAHVAAAPQHYDPNVHMPRPQYGAPVAPHAEPQGVMASLMGMTGGSLPASLMGSQAGSMSSMVGPGENRSPNRTPMGSMNGQPQHFKTIPPAQNPMSSFMNSMGFNSFMESEAKAGPVPATNINNGMRMH